MSGTGSGRLLFELPGEPAHDQRARVPVRAGVPLCLLAAVLCGATALVEPIAPLLVGLGLVLVLWAWQAPVVASVVVVAVCPALSGLSRSLGVSGLKLSELLLLVAAASVLARRPPVRARWSGVEWLLGVFAVVGLAFAAYHVVWGTSEGDTFVRVGLQPALLFLTWWTALRATRDTRELHLVLRWAMGISVLPAGLAILQVLNVGGVRQLVLDLTDSGLAAGPGDSGVVRATGPFPIWHSLGAYLLPVLLLVIALLVRDVRDVWGRGPLLAVLAVDTAALVLSLTVTIVLWVVVGVLVVAFLQRRVGRTLLLLAGVSVLASLAFGSQISSRIDDQSRTREASAGASSTFVPETLSYRFEVWERDYVPLINQAFPKGLGNEIPDSVLFAATENQYLTYLIRGGVWLVLAAIVAFVAIGARLAALRRDPQPAVRAAGVACLGALAFLPAACMVWPYTTNAGLPQTLLAIGGAAAGVLAQRASAVPTPA